MHSSLEYLKQPTEIYWPQRSRSAAKIGAQLIGKSDFISGGYTSGDIFSCFHG